MTHDYKMRWHNGQWQYLNYRTGRWYRYSRQPLPVKEAREAIAQWVYGCPIDQVKLDGKYDNVPQG